MSATDLTVGELKARALHDDFSSTKYGPICIEAMNELYREIIRTTSIAGAVLTSPVNTVLGDPLAAIPADNVLVVDVRRLNGALDALERDELLSLPAQSGQPQAYTIDGANFRFWPTPSSAEQLLVDFRQAPAQLDDDADKPSLLPNDYRYALAYHARAMCFDYEGDMEQATKWQQRADARLVTLRGDLQRRTRHNRRVAGSWADLRASSPQFHHPQGLF